MRTSSHRHRLTTAAAIIALSCGLGGAGGGLDGRGQDVTLETVLGRAAAYVEDYQRILGSVIAEEDYVQEYGDISRRTVSDLLLFSSPERSQPWLAFRDVLTVDGAPVEDRQARLAELLRSSPEVSAERWERLVEESARFNIGPIFRNVNAPTMALQLLTAADQPRSSFTARGEQDVGGVAAWIVDFQERDAPALIQGQRRQDFFAHGTFWIEPESGRVVQTELRTIDQTLIPFGAQGAVPAELTTQAVVILRRCGRLGENHGIP